MATITIDVPDELSEQLQQLGDRLPQLLQQCLQQPPLPARVYHYVLSFLASQPTPAEVASFRPTEEMQTRLRELVAKSKEGDLSEAEAQELTEYERIEHLIVMLKLGNLPYLTAPATP
ncbi:MAG: hypothetical protein F6K42_12460 [Leptolyngbya sp. SIO1D8]|nr:hypothetical protein [Leptolyngbya sp. SIO1D8]